MGDEAEWRKHRGGKCPVEGKAFVELRFRNGREHGRSKASDWRWETWPDGESDWDIVAWRRCDDE